MVTQKVDERTLRRETEMGGTSTAVDSATGIFMKVQPVGDIDCTENRISFAEAHKNWPKKSFVR